MPESVREFYDRLAGDYELLFSDWRKDVARQGAVLDRLIRAHLGDGPKRILDAACGIGTQAIGLATRGHHVHASDISSASVERARVESKAFAVDIDFQVVDMREIAPDEHDVVIACDNALAHLVTDEDVAAAARSVLASLRPGGIFVASLADYDEALKKRSRATAPQVFEGPSGTRLVQTLVDWAPDGRTYEFTLLILRRTGDVWNLETYTTTERALLRAEVAGILAGEGFTSVRWHTPAETGFFQPIVTARAPA